MPLALNNDHHFWGVVMAPVERRSTAIILNEIEDWVRLPKACADGDDDNEDDPAHRRDALHGYPSCKGRITLIHVLRHALRSAFQ